ncbi:MAG: cytochrome c biogenesis protein CcsA [Spirochaetes bacterium]|nr:cytochrome c biogenesis protein CcsA [Spirochaetota bacterium]
MHTGTLLLITSLVLAVINFIFLAQSARGNKFATITSRRIIYLIAIIVSFSFILLLQSFISNDFTLGYVYQHSSLDLPLFYKISALWAGQEGSFLLWLFFVSLIAVIIARGNDSNQTILLSVITIKQFFLLISLILYNPFTRLWETQSGALSHLLPHVPDGLGLNPLLQDFWMAVHPPLLFAGYASCVVPFAYAIVALMKNDYECMFINGYRWTIIAAALLGTGIFVGGYWAYAVLGWGGYWGWDPVENSSLIPWLLLVALFHGLIVQRRTGALVRTNCALALFQFLLVLYSAFLTRSGILSEFSVHSFSGEKVSYHMLYPLSFFFIISISLMVLRFQTARGASFEQNAISQESFIVFGLIVLTLYAGIIFVGTSMPIFTKMFASRPSAVTEEFYAIWSVPVGIMVPVFIALVTYTRGKEFEKKALALVASVSIASGIIFNLFRTTTPSAYGISIASFFAIFSIGRDWFIRRSKAHRPARIAHAAIAVTLIGIIATAYHSISIQKHLQKGVETLTGGVALTFMGITNEQTPHLRFIISAGNFSLERRAAYYYSERLRSVYKEPAIIRGVFNDLYIAPQWFAEGNDIAAIITLQKGETKTIGDVEITYVGIKETTKKSMQEGTPEVFVEVKIKQRNATHYLSPGFRISEKGNLEYIEARFSKHKRKLLLKNINPESKEATFFVEPAADAVIPPDEVFVEVSIKRLINFVWVGTTLISVGLFFAFWRVRK